VHQPFDEQFWRLVDRLQVQWLRLDLTWRDIEPQRGQRRWGTYDAFLREAQRRGIRTLLILNHPPDWAVADAPTFPHEARAFAHAAGEWAGRRVQAWEAFNEPNFAGHGWPFARLTAHDAAALYVATVAAVNEGLRAAGDTAPLLAGALSPDGHEPRAFIDQVFGLLPVACYDAVSIHPYGGRGRLGPIRQAVRDQVRRLSGRDAPVWITEYGSPEPAEQAPLLADAVRHLETGGGPLFWFSLRDLDWRERYGLVDGHGRPREAFELLRRAAAASGR
jgi:hypothetical protein